MTNTSFSFTFFRFIGEAGHRTTEVVRDFNLADGMRALCGHTGEQIKLANQKVSDWATSKSIAVTIHEPYPSVKYPGKVWLEYRFGGLSL